MDIHFRKQPAGYPQEIDEITDLPEQLLLGGRPFAQGSDRLHAISADELDFTQLPVADAADKFLPIARVAALQAGGNFQVLLLARVTRSNNPAHSRRIWGE